jgi:hypothetical protein
MCPPVNSPLLGSRSQLSVPGEAYEVEFTNKSGETLVLLALRPDQFIVVWRAETKKWVPIAERIAALMAHLAEEAGEEVLDFVRFVHSRSVRYRASGLWAGVCVGPFVVGRGVPAKGP